MKYPTLPPTQTKTLHPRSHVLQLTKEQAALFSSKMDELAAAGGWRPLPAAQWPSGVTAAAAVYVKPSVAAAAAPA